KPYPCQPKRPHGRSHHPQQHASTNSRSASPAPSHHPHTHTATSHSPHANHHPPSHNSTAAAPSDRSCCHQCQPAKPHSYQPRRKPYPCQPKPPHDRSHHPQQHAST